MDCTEGFTEKFETALDTLTRRKIVIHRPRNDTYALWEGSYIDIEAKRHEAEQHLDPNQSLTTYLSTLAPPRPFIARRHLFEKGTLRYFTLCYTDAENFDASLSQPLGEADGLVLYALPANEQEHRHLIEKVKEKAVVDRKEVLIAIPHSTGFLHDAVTELACLQWISKNTPELDGDPVARRVLSRRRLEAEQNVTEQFAAIFGNDSENTCKWFHKGQKVNINSQRERNEHLSKICDVVYHETPIILNELINRRKISGTVTTARKRLIQAMLENGDQEHLSITGYPPEMSIYRSLLWDTGIHREVEGAPGAFIHQNRMIRTELSHTWQGY